MSQCFDRRLRAVKLRKPRPGFKVPHQRWWFSKLDAKRVCMLLGSALCPRGVQNLEQPHSDPYQNLYESYVKLLIHRRRERLLRPRSILQATPGVTFLPKNPSMSDLGREIRFIGRRSELRFGLRKLSVPRGAHLPTTREVALRGNVRYRCLGEQPAAAGSRTILVCIRKGETGK